MVKNLSGTFLCDNGASPPMDSHSYWLGLT